MTSKASFAFVSLLLAVTACDDRPPFPPTDASRPDAHRTDADGADAGEGVDASPDGDASLNGDASPEVDGAPDVDSGTAADAGDKLDSGGGGVDAGGVDAGPCVPPVCPPVPEGCRYEGMTMCACGVLVCPMRDCGGTTCSPDQYCDYTAPMSCGGAGVCRARPSACPEVYMPVCACNGAEYNNACEAHAAGQDIAFEGNCPPPTSCREVGCPMFQMCVRCGDHDICLPLGASC